MIPALVAVARNTRNAAARCSGLVKGVAGSSCSCIQIYCNTMSYLVNLSCILFLTVASGNALGEIAADDPYARARAAHSRPNVTKKMNPIARKRLKPGANRHKPNPMIHSGRVSGLTAM